MRRPKTETPHVLTASSKCVRNRQKLKGCVFLRNSTHNEFNGPREGWFPESEDRLVEFEKSSELTPCQSRQGCSRPKHWSWLGARIASASFPFLLTMKTGYVLESVSVVPHPERLHAALQQALQVPRISTLRKTTQSFIGNDCTRRPPKLTNNNSGSPSGAPFPV